jgi:hypothetical protein
MKARCLSGIALLTFAVLAALVPLSAGEKKDPLDGYRPRLAVPPGTSDRDPAVDALFIQTAYDTFVLGEWDFEPCVPQGWTSRDVTAQLDTFWHVDGDSSATCMSGKVMWCGTHPNAAIPYCSWDDLPGYGNGWEQFLRTKPFPVSGTIQCDFRLSWDTEIGFDYVHLQYDERGKWVDHIVLDGKACDSLLSTEIVPVGVIQSKLRFLFESDTGFSDEDGFDASEWGAVALDEALITSGGDTVVAFEDWEDDPAGAHAGLSGADTTWYAKVPEGVGDFVGFDNGLWEEDPCRNNIGCQLYFYDGSTLTDPLYPGTFVVPRDINNEALSPKVDWDAGGTVPSGATKTLFEFDVYRDLPLGGSIFYVWGIRTYSTTDPTCPGEWRDRNFVYYGPDKEFLISRNDVSDLIDPNPDSVQVRLATIDLCDPFCIDFVWPTGPHTPSPTFDNVRLLRVNKRGPAFSESRNVDFFQDDFPEDGSTTGTVRIDMANDINPQAVTTIRPGDSLVVSCGAPTEGGLLEPPTLHVRVSRGPHAGLADASLQGTYGTWTGAAGAWSSIVMDSARAADGTVGPGKWAVGLNDSLFTPGDVLHYFFSATSGSLTTGTFPEDTTGGNFLEVSCLPTPGRDILYVDDFDGRGAEPYFVSALEQAGYGDRYDRYDVNAASSLIANGPGGRVKDVSQIQVYDKIVWGSGDLDIGTISDGVADKGKDALLLRDYLRQTGHDVGIWVSGDDVAFDLDQSTTAAAIDLLNNWFGVSFVQQSQFDLTGVPGPTLTAEPGSPWAAAPACSTHIAYGGCPGINKFDVLETNGGSQYGFVWPGHNPGAGDPRGAVLYNSQPNDSGFTARTVWQAYSFHLIRDDSPGPVPDRTCFLDATLQWLGNTPGLPTAAGDVPAAHHLAQNAPNPFNPATRIRFALPEATHVKLTVYDVAGRRVKLLLDRQHEAGWVDVLWNGTNDQGRAVGSGVYFYKLEAGAFEARRKMVLLK